MTAVPVAIVDALNSLLEAEVNSLFRFVGEGSPYVSSATADVRRPLADMVVASTRHARELAGVIDALGGVATAHSRPGEEAYLAYLSLKFLLPKLVEAKGLMVERYENVRDRMPDAPRAVSDLLDAHLADHRADLDVLRRATERAMAGR